MAKEGCRWLKTERNKGRCLLALGAGKLEDQRELKIGNGVVERDAGAVCDVLWLWDLGYGLCMGLSLRIN